MMSSLNRSTITHDAVMSGAQVSHGRGGVVFSVCVTSPLTLEALKDFLKDKLGKHEMIGALEVRAALPKTPVGKLSKKDLVDEEAQRRAA
mgnify:CR=1 FL=1